MARLGMNPEAVESAARQLNNQASSIDSLIRQIDQTVHNLAANWDGPDAQQFVNTLWPQHKKALTTAQQQIVQLAQTAKRNLDAQRSTSQSLS